MNNINLTEKLKKIIENIEPYYIDTDLKSIKEIEKTNFFFD